MDTQINTRFTGPFATEVYAHRSGAPSRVLNELGNGLLEKLI